MRQILLNLEKQSRILDPSSGDRGAVREKVVAYTEDFLENIESRKAYNVNDGDGAGLLDSEISEEGIGIDEAMRLLEENVHSCELAEGWGLHAWRAGHDSLKAQPCRHDL